MKFDKLQQVLVDASVRSFGRRETRSSCGDFLFSGPWIVAEEGDDRDHGLLGCQRRVNNAELGIIDPPLTTKQAMIPIIAFLGYDPRAGKQEVTT